jgi:hypothetical protein
MFKGIRNFGRLGKVGALLSAGLVAAAVHDDAKAGKIVAKMETERSLFTDERAIGLVDGAISLVIGAVVMGVGMMILGQVFPNITGTDADSNASIEAMKSTTWSAMGLLPIGLTVFAAVVIIGIVMYLRQ